MTTRRLHLMVALALTTAVTMSATPASAAPGLVPVHGVIADSDGVPLDGLQDVVFALYPGEFASDPVWSSERAVSVHTGRFVAYLGEATELELDLFADHSELWLGVAIGEDPELDRLQLGVAPWSAHSQTCGDAATVGGLTAEELGAQGGGGEGGEPLTVEALQALLDSVYLSVDWLPAWEGLQSVPAGFADGVDDDTTYSAGAGLTLDGSTFSVAPASEAAPGGVHAGSCEVGDVVTGIDESGMIICTPDKVGAGGDTGAAAPPGFTPTTTLTTNSFLAGLAIAAHGGWVYFSQGVGPNADGDYTIERVALGGGPSTTLLEVESRVRELAIDGEHIYWRNIDDELYRMPIDGGPEELLETSSVTTVGLALEGDLVVWGTVEGVRSMNKAGGLVNAHCSHHVNDVKTASGVAYHSGHDGVFAVDLVGVETALAERLQSGYLTLTAEHVVVAGNNVVSIPKDGGPPQRVPAPDSTARMTTVGDYVLVLGKGGIIQAFRPAQPDRGWVVGAFRGSQYMSVTSAGGMMFGFEDVAGENNTFNIYSLDVSWALAD